MISGKDFKFKQFVFVSPKDGDRLSIKNDNVIVSDASGKVKHQSTCYRVFAIFIIGNMSFTTAIVQKAKKYGFGIVFMTNSFRPYYVVSNNGDANVLLREKQYKYKELDTARSIIVNKVHNQCLCLKNVRNKGVTLYEAIDLLEQEKHKIKYAENIQELMGYEGYASKHYFKAYFDNVNWQGRKPRLKMDIANSLLDIGYSVLFGFIESLLEVYGFDVYKGVLHTQFYMRKSLVCDVMEPFRVIVDKCVKKGINLKQFSEEDFEVVKGKYFLKIDKSLQYSKIFASAILDYKDEIFTYVQMFYRYFMKGCVDGFCPHWEIKCY